MSRDRYGQSTTACCPRETIPDSCSCPEGCGCVCLDCDCPYPLHPDDDLNGDDSVLDRATRRCEMSTPDYACRCEGEALHVHCPWGGYHVHYINDQGDDIQPPEGHKFGPVYRGQDVVAGSPDTPGGAA